MPKNIHSMAFLRELRRYAYLTMDADQEHTSIIVTKNDETESQIASPNAFTSTSTGE